MSEKKPKPGAEVPVWMGGRLFDSMRLAAAHFRVSESAISAALKRGGRVKGMNIYRVGQTTVGGKRGS